jgi:hypothetical protein
MAQSEPVQSRISQRINENVFAVGRWALFMAAGGFAGLLGLIALQLIVPILLNKSLSIALVPLPYGLAERNLPEYLLASFGVHILLFVVILLSGLVGYRLVKASGANPTEVIPAQDYELLEPLIQGGKADAIDQYVRLSSLSGFTGTFTQLGLTGLPLATIFMTLFFTCLTIYRSDIFLDLTKLTLGAFLGSFVQRQVEQRRTSTEDVSTSSDEAAPPPLSA